MVNLPNLLSRKRREKEEKQEKSDTSQASKTAAVPQTGEAKEKHSGLVGSAVKSLLKHFDEKALGLKFVLGATHVDAFRGRVSVDGLTIKNPEGFNSEYLLHAGKLVIDLDMKTLLKSMGKTLELEEVLLDDVEVIYEMSWSGSNVDVAMKKMGKAKPKINPSDPLPIVHKVLLSNIGAKAVTTHLGNLGPCLHLGDISYKDFNAEVGPHSVGDGVMLVLETLLKSIVTTVIGRDRCKSTWSVLEDGKNRFRAAISKLHEQVSQMCSCTCCHAGERGEELIIQAA